MLGEWGWNSAAAAKMLQWTISHLRYLYFRRTELWDFKVPTLYTLRKYTCASTDKVGRTGGSRGAGERKGSVIYVNSSPMISWVIDRLVCSWGNANLINSMMDNLRRWCHNVILLLISINFCNKCPNYDVKIISKVRWKVWNLHYNSFGITHRMLCFFFVSNLGPFRILSSLSWLGGVSRESDAFKL